MLCPVSVKCVVANMLTRTLRLQFPRPCDPSASRAQRLALEETFTSRLPTGLLLMRSQLAPHRLAFWPGVSLWKDSNLCSDQGMECSRIRLSHFLGRSVLSPPSPGPHRFSNRAAEAQHSFSRIRRRREAGKGVMESMVTMSSTIL